MVLKTWRPIGPIEPLLSKGWGFSCILQIMKILSVCSARPNFVKLAAVHHAIEETCKGDVEHIIVHTGQHYDPLFSDVFFEQLKIPTPVYNLGIHGGTREEVIQATQEAFEEILPKIQPDVVLVYGDVNGMVGTSLAAKEAGIRLAHVEAGLRSFDHDMPEEVNRLKIDEMADLLLCSEESGVENAQKEKLKGQIHLVGNTMIDTLIRMLPLIEKEQLPADLPEQFAVVTMHRPSNVDSKEAFTKNIEFLNEVASKMPLILPAHHRFKSALEQFGLSDAMSKNIRIQEPLGYIPFLRLVKASAFILTDSGGIQEEATYLEKRCFTLRKNTERPSTIESGSNSLIDIDVPSDRQMVFDFAANPEDFHVNVPAIWDGKAGERIVDVLMTR